MLICPALPSLNFYFAVTAVSCPRSPPPYLPGLGLLTLVWRAVL